MKLNQIPCPERWKLCSLGDIGKSYIGLTYKPENVVSKGGTLVLRSSNVFNNRISYEDNVFVDVPIPDRMLTKQGDILICVRNGSQSLIGKNVLINESSAGHAFGAFMAVFRSEVNDYLVHLFQTDLYSAQIYKNLGATINQITNKDLEKFVFPIPPNAERNKIVQILATWDHAIGLVQDLLTAKKQRKKGLMQQLLTGNVRLPEFIEQNWEDVAIGDLLKPVTRFIEWDDNQLYRQVIVRRWSEGLMYREPLYGHQIKTKNLQQIFTGDFLISNIQAAYGAMSKVQSEYNGAYISNLYTILVIKHDDLIDINYFDFFSRLPIMQWLVVRSSNGFKAERIRLNFALKDFLKQKIRVPSSIDEQRAISELLLACDREIELLGYKSEALQQQKKALLQQLLTGQTRVQV